MLFYRLAISSVDRPLVLSNNPALSLIVCIDKEFSTFEESLKMFLDQDYQDYRIILIDNSVDYIISQKFQELENNNQKLKIYKHKKKPREGKKSAILRALSINNSPLILFTDADCMPISKSWISQMVAKVNSDKSDVVLAYSPFMIEEPNLRNNWIHYEGFFTAVQYFSFALINLPYMGVGRNILYRQSILSSDIITRHKDLMSGDDDLSVNQLSISSKISICTQAESHVITYPEKSWGAYFKQKSRHFSTAHRYRFSHIVLLSAYSFSHFFFFISALLILFLGNPIIPLVAVLLRCAFVVPISKKIRENLKSPINTSMFLFLDFVHIVFYMFFAIPVVFPQKSKW